jgi:transcriptional regulator with XRE-family HTH domain
MNCFDFKGVPLEIKKAFALVLKEIREEMNLSQEKLAEKCECHTTIIGRLETFKREPKISTIFKIVDAIDIPIDVFMKRIDKKRRQD